MSSRCRDRLALAVLGGAFVVAVVAPLSSCGPGEQPRPAVDAFAVSYACENVSVYGEDGQWTAVACTEDGRLRDPIRFGNRTKVVLDVTAVGRPDYDGYARVSAVPGEIRAVRSTDSDVLRTSVHVTGSAQTRIEVEFEGAFGDTRIWVEDVGLDPGPATGAACDDGEDNDGDGLADYPLDPGCYMRNDADEGPGSHAVGVSEVIPFANPRLSDAQGCAAVPTLSRQSLTVDRGQLIVTAVFVDGFTVSDYAFLVGGCEMSTGCCHDGRYAHMYAYNFNTPYGMRVCDRLASLTGTVGDFYGFTELNFPSWEMYDNDPETPGIDLMRVPPAELTEELCPVRSHEVTDGELLSNTAMESWEGGLVDIVDAELPPDEDWVNCDLNGDFEVAYKADLDVCVPADEANVPDEYCSTRSEGFCCELDCNDTCNMRMCAEIMNYRYFGQYPVRVAGARVLLDTTNVPDFDPRALVRGGRTGLDRITGVVRQFAPLDFPWILQPRCRQDIYIEGDDRFPDVPIYRRCVPSEETGDYEDPY